MEVDRSTKPEKNFSAIVIITFSLIIIIMGALTFTLPRPTFSESENRILADLPEISGESVLSGEFFSDLGKFCSDRLPFRIALLKLKCICELGSLKGENNGVIVSRSRALIKRHSSQNNIFNENIKDLENFSSNGKSRYIAIAPRTIDVLTYDLPRILRGYEDELYNTKTNIDLRLIKNELKHHAENNGERSGEYVMYRTDHHYTTLGAYYTYAILGERLGYTPYPKEGFSVITISDDFLGTTQSACLFPFPRKDEISIWQRQESKNDTLTVTDVMTGRTSDSLYDLSFADKKDKYSVFLGGNSARISVRHDDKRPLLLVIKDSFGNALAPFLAEHFDLELVDPRYLRSSLSDIVAEVENDPNFAGTLVLFGVETLQTTPDLMKK